MKFSANGHPTFSNLIQFMHMKRISMHNICFGVTQQTHDVVMTSQRRPYDFIFDILCPLRNELVHSSQSALTPDKAELLLNVYMS